MAFPSTPDVDAIMQDVIDELEDQGATVIEVDASDRGRRYGPEFEALLCEFKTDIRTYLGRTPVRATRRTSRALIRFNKANPDLEGPWNSQIFVDAQATGGRSDPACKAARAAATPVVQEHARRSAGGL